MKVFRMFLVMLLLTSCQEHSYIVESKLEPQPTFDVWGYVTGKIPSGEPVLLYKVNNITLEYQLENLRYLDPVEYTRTEEGGIFRFDNLSTGTYCILILSISFNEAGGQGFPYIEEYQYNNYSITQAWAGGNSGHSLAILEIKPSDLK